MPSASVDNLIQLPHLPTSRRRRPVILFITGALIIFVAEVVVMYLMPELGELTLAEKALVDAALLSLLVVPTLYLFFFRPMRQNIERLEQSEEYRQQLQKIDRIKSDFVAIAAHELCTPVSVIMGYTDLLLAQDMPAREKQYLEVIAKKTQALERIIDDLLVLKRYEQESTVHLDLECHDLVEVVADVASYYVELFSDKPIHLQLPHEPLKMVFDKVRISQVVDNLLSNAIKYSNSIHDEIDLKTIDKEDRVEIIVRDEGIGMTTEELKYVYDRFFRAETERSAVGGLGLGMAIVKSIVESHKGTIDILSMRGIGTTVTVSLPKFLKPPVAIQKD